MLGYREVRYFLPAKFANFQFLAGLGGDHDSLDPLVPVLRIYAHDGDLSDFGMLLDEFLNDARSREVALRGQGEAVHLLEAVRSAPPFELSGERVVLRLDDQHWPRRRAPRRPSRRDGEHGKSRTAWHSTVAPAARAQT